MVRVLGYQHLGQQAGRRNAFVDNLRGYRCLNQSLALGAGPFTANVALHGEQPRRVVELFADVLADAFQGAAVALCKYLSPLG